ncbi:hypothetical protein GCM10010467_03230 [Actinocorallia glomerata]|uniref:Uncharacterized protein n=2 Tax=Actinomycetes TaxID=1760 RepID=A0ABP6LSR2_9MICC
MNAAMSSVPMVNLSPAGILGTSTGGAGGGGDGALMRPPETMMVLQVRASEARTCRTHGGSMVRRRRRIP